MHYCSCKISDNLWKLSFHSNGAWDQHQWMISNLSSSVAMVPWCLHDDSLQSPSAWTTYMAQNLLVAMPSVTSQAVVEAPGCASCTVPSGLHILISYACNCMGKKSLQSRVVRKELCIPPLLSHAEPFPTWRVPNLSGMGEAQSSENRCGLIYILEFACTTGDFLPVRYEVVVQRLDQQTVSLIPIRCTTYWMVSLSRMRPQQSS